MSHDPMKVETVGYLAQWRTLTFHFDSYMTISEPFKIAKWNWHISLSRLTNTTDTTIKLYPEKSMDFNSPIATFKIRFLDQSVGKYGKVLAKLEVKDKLMITSESDAFTWTFNVSLPIYYGARSSFVEVEFLDLKTSNPNNKRKRPITTLDRMLRDSIHTDTTINLISSEKSIRVHRDVLATWSPVFDSKFTHDFTENNTCVINISDMSFEFCQAFMSYIYDNIKNEEHEIYSLDLLAAAEKYGVNDLKKEGEKCLQEDINIKSILVKLETTYYYQLPNLKISCAKYLVQFGKIHEIWDEFVFDAFIKTLDKDTICEIFCELIS